MLSCAPQEFCIFCMIFFSTHFYFLNHLEILGISKVEQKKVLYHKANTDNETNAE